MLMRSQVWKYPTVARFAIVVTAAVIGLPATVPAAEVQCQFKAESEATEVHVLKDGETKWTGSIAKLETKTVSIPEGPFTLISKVYNPNLKRKEDIRADIHTRLCGQQALTVPLFPESKER